MLNAQGRGETSCARRRAGGIESEERAVKGKRWWLVATMATAAVGWFPAPGLAASQVAGLEADADSAPLGLDDATPRLSWRVSSDERGVAQASYHVVVA